MNEVLSVLLTGDGTLNKKVREAQAGMQRAHFTPDLQASKD